MATVRFYDLVTMEEDLFLRDHVILDVQVADWSFSEEATPLAPGDSAGATAQFTVKALTKSRTDLALDHIMELNLDDGERLLGVVQDIDTDNSSDGVTLTLDGLLNRFNTEVDMPPILDKRFDEAVVTWAGLVKIPSSLVVVDSRIASRRVNWPGSKNINLWDAIKQVCAAYGYEAYSTGDSVGFRLPGEIDLYVSPSSTVKRNIRRDQRTSKVTMKAYHSVAHTADAVVYKADQVFTVDAGATTETSVTIEGSLASLGVLTPVSGMDFASTSGQYVVTGSDGYIVTPQLWTEYGGRIEATIGADYNEINLKIVGAALTSRSPFRISEGAADRPALWVSGKGILHTPEEITLLTGDTQASTVGTPPVVDNIFLTDTIQVWERGAHAAQYFGNPEISITITGTPWVRLVRRQEGVPEEELTARFGFFAGAMVKFGEAVYRVSAVTYSPRGMDVTLTEYTTIEDFNLVWAGKTFAQFESSIGPDLTFAQHSVRPLTTGVL